MGYEYDNTICIPKELKTLFDFQREEIIRLKKQLDLCKIQRNDFIDDPLFRNQLIMNADKLIEEVK